MSIPFEKFTGGIESLKKLLEGCIFGPFSSDESTNLTHYLKESGLMQKDGIIQPYSFGQPFSISYQNGHFSTVDTSHNDSPQHILFAIVEKALANDKKITTEEALVHAHQSLNDAKGFIQITFQDDGGMAMTLEYGQMDTLQKAGMIDLAVYNLQQVSKQIKNQVDLTNIQ